MKLSDAIGLELERREKVMDDCEKAYRAWAKSLPPTSINRTYGDVWKAAWGYQQARIEALEAERRWIPVSERLPDIAVDVLAYSPDFGVEVCHQVGGNWSNNAPGSCPFGATHWMPLPSTPEDK